MNALAWPFAKLEDVVGTVIVVIIVIISVVAQLINKAREVQKEAGRHAGPVPPQGGERQDPLGDEIEEFLKRAAQRRQTAGGGRPAPQASAPAGGGSPPPPRRLVEQPVAAELIPEEGQPESVAAHVRDHLSPAKFAPVSQELGREVTELDTKMQRHLQDKFDHRVGRLAGMGGQSAQVQSAVDLETTAERRRGGAPVSAPWRRCLPIPSPCARPSCFRRYSTGPNPAGAESHQVSSTSRGGWGKAKHAPAPNSLGHRSAGAPGRVLC